MSPQLDHRNYSYELFKFIIEKDISKFTAKILYYNILYSIIQCVDLLMWSPTKLEFLF